MNRSDPSPTPSPTPGHRHGAAGAQQQASPPDPERDPPGGPVPEAMTAVPAAAEDQAGVGATVSLAPRFFVPLAVSLLGALCIPLQASWGGFRWLALALVLFGGFLLLQARLLRLSFAPEALVVWRGEQEIRRFPYQAWLGWRLFWPALPVLFYFREERSIHLLPVLFDAAGLREQLRLRLPHLVPPQAP